MNTSEFAGSQEEAERRHLMYRDVDPLPDVAPALLNSADIMDYVAATGMLFPFNDSGGKLKPASYEVDVLGTTLFWDEDGRRIMDYLKRGDTFTLRRNSIAFVEVEPHFRLPHYIAVRFNLRIKHVYRGLLLGTGPLIDPGFKGRLFIPLHNLTDNDYVLEGGEGLLWMEFTKLHWPRPRFRVADDDVSRNGEFREFEPAKLEHDLKYYLERAADGRPIRSSLPIERAALAQEAGAARAAATESRDAAQKAATDAEEASESAEAATKKIAWTAIIAIIAVSVALCSLMISVAIFVTAVARGLDHRVRALEARVPDKASVVDDPANPE